MNDLDAFKEFELSKEEMINFNGGGVLAYYTGYILGKLFSAYGEANPGPRQCPI